VRELAGNFVQVTSFAFITPTELCASCELPEDMAIVSDIGLNLSDSGWIDDTAKGFE